MNTIKNNIEFHNIKIVITYSLINDSSKKGFEFINTCKEIHIYNSFFFLENLFSTSFSPVFLQKLRLIFPYSDVQK